MPESKHSYILSDAAPSAEVERLRQVDAYMGPITRRHLERLGIARGWRCLEVGAGVGGVARWMAERVGPPGKVVATDIAPLFEPDPDLPQLEVRRHDILEAGLEEGTYDLVHGRLLLVNVGAGNVEAALRRMTEALRPGGWLLVEEPGEGRFPGVGESDPRVAEFNRLAEGFLRALQGHTGAVELDLYRRLPGLLEARGLVEIGGEQAQVLVGLEGRAAFRGTLRAVLPILAGTPFVEDGRMARLAELASDPALLTMGGSTLSLWGRRAA